MQTFPLNALDLNFLLSSDGKSLDLPNSVIFACATQRMLEKDELVDALVELANIYPELRLACTLDYKNLCWVEIDQDYHSFFSQLVSIAQNNSVSERLSTLSRKSEYLFPFEITVTPTHFFLRQNHVFGDGNFALHLIELLFSVYVNGSDSLPALKIAPPISEEFMAKYQLDQCAQFIDPNKNQAHFHVQFPQIKPAKAITNQIVKTTIFDEKQLKLLEAIREKLSGKDKISINTLLNVLLSYFFAHEKMQNQKTYLSIPTHLSPYYLSDIYPYNFITNIDVYIDTPQSSSELRKITQAAQASISQIQKDGSLLNKVIASIKEYQRSPQTMLHQMQQNYLRWFEKIEQTYVLSNLGIIDAILPITLEKIILNSELFVSAPCIGAQPLTVFVVRVKRQLNLTWVMDTSRVSHRMYSSIIDQFSIPNLEKLLGEIS